MSGRQAVHALSLGRIPIAASDGRGEAALIDRHGLEAATKVSLTKPQKPSSLQRAALFVARRFFSGSIPSCGARSRCHGARPRNVGPLPPASGRHAWPCDTARPPNPACERCSAQVALCISPPGLSHRYTLASPTLNRRAASALLPPLRTKSTTRWRKSPAHLMRT